MATLPPRNITECPHCGSDDLTEKSTKRYVHAGVEYRHVKCHRCFDIFPVPVGPTLKTLLPYQEQLMKKNITGTIKIPKVAPDTIAWDVVADRSPTSSYPTMTHIDITNELMDATLEEQHEAAEKIRKHLDRNQKLSEMKSFTGILGTTDIKGNVKITVILPKEVEKYRSRFIHVTRHDLADRITLAVLKPPAVIQDPRLAWDDHINGDQVLHKEYVCHRVYGTVYEAQP